MFFSSETRPKSGFLFWENVVFINLLIMNAKKQIRLVRGKHYWILKEGEDTPEIATYERALNGQYHFYQIEINHIPECKSVDVPFTVIKEVIFEKIYTLFTHFWTLKNATY